MKVIEAEAELESLLSSKSFPRCRETHQCGLTKERHCGWQAPSNSCHLVSQAPLELSKKCTPGPRTGRECAANGSRKVIHVQEWRKFIVEDPTDYTIPNPSMRKHGVLKTVNNDETCPVYLHPFGCRLNSNLSQVNRSINLLSTWRPGRGFFSVASLLATWASLAGSIGASRHHAPNPLFSAGITASLRPMRALFMSTGNTHSVTKNVHRISLHILVELSPVLVQRRGMFTVRRFVRPSWDEHTSVFSGSGHSRWYQIVGERLVHEMNGKFVNRGIQNPVLARGSRLTRLSEQSEPSQGAVHLFGEVPQN